jgi:aspartyl-tRNA(Asn)/glutamyl-tRNA(Gln) amidotransferase subunit A
MTDICHLSLSDLAEGLNKGHFSCLEATRACLERIDATDDLNAYLHVNQETALEQARRSDERRRSGETLGVLDGVPVGLKDMFLTLDQPTTCASNILKGFVPPYDGTVVRKLKEAGAVLIGKLNMDSFAMGSSTEHSDFGPTRNPWDKERVPGGSSGGSAAAVASGTAVAALGTDTGGSVRQPASFCGIVGLKPTYGRVSRYGVVAFASSLDQVGPMTKDVRDCAHLLQTIAGYDSNDSTSARMPVPDYSACLDTGVKGMRLGLPRQYFVKGVDSEVTRGVEDAIDTFRRLGASVEEVDLPHTQYAIASYYLICTAEASSNLARYDGVRFGLRCGEEGGLGEMYAQTRAQGFGSEVKRRIILGSYVLCSGHYDAYYLKAQKVRTLIKNDFDKVFDRVDALITPTSPTTAFRLKERSKTPLEMYLADIFTVSCNLAGIAGLSIPCGFDSDNLPIGLQLLGAPWSEAKLLQIGRAYEREHQWHRMRAP